MTMQLLSVASEVYPLVKTGGLADVSAARAGSEVAPVSEEADVIAARMTGGKGQIVCRGTGGAGNQVGLVFEVVVKVVVDSEPVLKSVGRRGQVLLIGIRAIGHF